MTYFEIIFTTRKLNLIAYDQEYTITVNYIDLNHYQLWINDYRTNIVGYDLVDTLKQYILKTCNTLLQSQNLKDFIEEFNLFNENYKLVDLLSKEV